VWRLLKDNRPYEVADPRLSAIALATAGCWKSGPIASKISSVSPVVLTTAD